MQIAKTKHNFKSPSSNRIAH